jgi:hypothetical protein
MKAYDATSVIDASPATIWAILTDAPGYARWDSGVLRVDGRIAAGEKLKLVAEVNPKRAFSLQVTEFRPGERMTWTGGMPLGLFRGVRTFALAPQDGGATGFTMREEYSGPLLAMIGRALPDLGPSFQKFATGLKRQAEQAR